MFNEITKLERIQKRNNLNEVYVLGPAHPVNGGFHRYEIVGSTQEHKKTLLNISFQSGPRNEPDSEAGVLDTDLLEIVRHRLNAFQKGAFSNRETALALTHVEEALLWLTKRAEDRFEKGILGKNIK
jgi:hypothetical protein